MWSIQLYGGITPRKNRLVLEIEERKDKKKIFHVNDYFGYPLRV